MELLPLEELEEIDPGLLEEMEQGGGLKAMVISKWPQRQLLLRRRGIRFDQYTGDSSFVLDGAAALPAMQIEPSILASAQADIAGAAGDGSVAPVIPTQTLQAATLN